jgi:hypothetical protein
MPLLTDLSQLILVRGIVIALLVMAGIRVLIACAEKREADWWRNKDRHT